MRKLNILVFLSLITLTLQAQFVNNGATVTIQSGATLRVETDFTNMAGTVNNNGTIEVSGNFTNDNLAILATTGNLKFITATGSPSNATLNTGGQSLKNVEMAKTSGHTVTLGAAATILGDLNFTGSGSKIVLGTYDLTLGDTSDVITPGAAGYVVTDKTGVNTGSFVKIVPSGMSTRTLEIGDDMNYSPVTMAVNASSSGTIKSRVISNATPNPPLTPKYGETTDFINREWVVSTTNITANTLTGTYVDGDIVGIESMIKGATFHTGDWRFDGAAGVPLSNTISATTTTADVRFSGKNFFGKIYIKAFLQGAYSGGTMTPSLNSSGILQAQASTSPYVDAAASVGAGFFAANPTIVDWVKLELRDPNFPSTPTSFKASAFIKSNGDVVGVDGMSLPRVKGGFPTAVVVLSHRNHLAIRTVDVGLDVVNPITQHNFSTSIGQAFTSVTPVHPNANMQNLGGGVFGLWAGNGNGNSVVNYGSFGSDRTFLLSQPNTPGSITRGLGSDQSVTISNVYSNNDLNMNGTINYGSFGSDRTYLLSTVLGNDQTKTLNQHQ